MATKSSRIFVGNLPHEVTRDEIVKMFRKYGIVESVEMKTKQDTNTGSVLATFCYVNLDTDHDSLENCILLLNGIKCGERHIKVEIAKESFLQRLQRERQSSLKTPGSQPALAVLAAPTDTIKYSKSSKSGEKVSSKITKSKIELQDEKSEVQNENKRSPANKEKSTSKKNTQFRKGHTSLSESSESDDSDEELEEFHPTSKLPMFKGIGSVIPRDSVITNQPLGCSSTHNHSQINKDTREKYEARMLPSKAKSGLDTSSSILKKFELFSDVWKDTDEPHSGGRKSQVYKNTNMSLQESDYNVPLTTTAAEEKRLKSLESRRQAFEQQKRAIQHALSDKTSSRINKKIVFSDDNSDACGALVAQTKAIFALENQVSDGSNKGKKKTLALFEESDEEATNDNWTGEFKVKKQFEGSKGKKLLDLQNSYNNDQRFKLDERFYESDDDSNVKSMPGSEREPDNAEEHIEGLAEEREQQLQILSSIIGRPIPVTNPPSQSESRTKGMLRFDPLKPSHLKYELSKEVKENKKKRKPKVSDLEKKEGEVEEDEELVKPKVRREEKEPEPVSQNKFYSVSETLAESLKLSKEGQSSGFSLLQMFGSPETLPEKDEQYSNVSTKKLELKRPPTLEDSFSCNDEANDVGSPSTIASNTVPQETSFRNGVFKSTGGVWQESLFFHSDDSRLKEGNEFFSSFDDSSDVKFAVKREALRHIVKRKIRNSSRKANSFKTKVGALHKKNSLWPKTVSKPQIRRRQRH